MGQYYKVVFKREQDAKPIVNDRKVNGQDYIMAKLMEHGYMLNPLCMSVAKMLEDGKCRLAWVGDYADEDVEKVTGGELKYEDVWGGDVNETHVFRSAKNFSYGGKYLVNHTKKEYISFDRYVNRHVALKGVEDEESKWMLSPFTILTAVGNGQGGGDYFGLEMKRVGSWAWDEISIERTVPEGFTLLDIVFEEGMEDPKEETPSGKKVWRVSVHLAGAVDVKVSADTEDEAGEIAKELAPSLVTGMEVADTEVLTATPEGSAE